MSEQNQQTAQRFFEIYSSGDLDQLDPIVAPDAVDHDPYNPHGNDGLEGVKKTMAMYREAFPDVHFAIEDQIEADDRVVTRWTATGTHDGELMGVPASHKTSTVTGMSIDRFEDGKVVESWNQWDVMGLMQNIGAVPATQPA